LCRQDQNSKLACASHSSPITSRSNSSRSRSRGKKFERVIETGPRKLVGDIACRARARRGVWPEPATRARAAKSGDERTNTIAPAVRRRLCKVGGWMSSAPSAATPVSIHALRGEFDVLFAIVSRSGLAPLKPWRLKTGGELDARLPFTANLARHRHPLRHRGPRLAITEYARV